MANADDEFIVRQDDMFVAGVDTFNGEVDYTFWRGHARIFCGAEWREIWNREGFVMEPVDAVGTFVDPSSVNDEFVVRCGTDYVFGVDTVDGSADLTPHRSLARIYRGDHWRRLWASQPGYVVEPFSTTVVVESSS